MFLLGLELSSEEAKLGRRALVRTAEREGHGFVAFIFDEHTDSEHEKPKRLPYNLDRPLTLGERKSLARTSNRRLLDRVLRDPEPSVIQSVLENPHLTETDVLSIASSKGNAAVLTPVLSSPRWIVRYDVRTSLAFNPFLPLARALALTASLRSSELREICRGGVFRARQVELAEALLIRRGQN